jgi:hypothetical protein
VVITIEVLLLLPAEKMVLGAAATGNGLYQGTAG